MTRRQAVAFVAVFLLTQLVFAAVLDHRATDRERLHTRSNCHILEVVEDHLPPECPKG